MEYVQIGRSLRDPSWKGDGIVWPIRSREVYCVASDFRSGNGR